MIYLLVPDATVLYGGIQQAYLIVEVLNELGFKAVVYHGQRDFRCDWFASRAPAIGASHLTLERGDVLVMPEYAGNQFQALTAGARVVMLNQGFINTFNGAGLEDRWTGTYPGWPNAVAVLAMSEANEQFVRAALRGPLPVHRLRCVVDADQFAPSPKERKIAFMPRRRYRDVEAVIQLLHGTVTARGWKLAALDDLTRSEVAQSLSTAAIFLSFADREGFGLPAAEAMAAGCYVIGYSGTGGREFMDPAWCSCLDGSDLVAFAEEVDRVSARWDAQDPALASAVSAARSTVASRFTREGLAKDLYRAFSALTAVDSPALQQTRVQIRHPSSLVGPRLRERIKPLVPTRVWSLLSPASARW